MEHPGVERVIHHLQRLEEYGEWTSTVQRGRIAQECDRARSLPVALVEQPAADQGVEKGTLPAGKHAEDHHPERALLIALFQLPAGILQVLREGRGRGLTQLQQLRGKPLCFFKSL